MKLYQLINITIKMGTTATVATGIQGFYQDTAAKGKLLGVFFSDIGQLNQVVVLRSYSSQQELDDENARLAAQENLFDTSENIIKYSVENFAGFDFLPEVEVGEFGPVYEIRTYELKHGGVPHVLEAWKNAVPTRTQYSKLTIAMYALDGTPRIVSIWPYSSLNERSEVRAKSVADGIWPPKGGPQWLTHEMQSMIALPTSVSPLK
ncbi:NIPSNAP family protein [Acinetobacter baumannii]|uniref:NIPSNAP family protein n=1 Tax=Acinetobacter baumannii TaxID=470 RepID=UPI00233F1173|nr:NIPSNAP family protein [Acinetobacter baumannii]MDC4285802.1 NIPSNAP family protein [Acinetobacter baumannii]MDC4289192.1 NIPSNAP family protein [Acinetobacter baumannii]MDC4291375.1 NIPSNAP family protein [Acinetobacter baumannii]MDC4321047.1 NIPSNAP family protein [Acinetobacter baumannii]